LLAPSVHPEPAAFDEVRELYGTVVAVDAGLRRSARVKLRLDDGGVIDLEADLAVAQRAARLFTKRVRAMTSLAIAGDADAEGALEEIDAWDFDDATDDDPLRAFDEATRDLRHHGVSASEWIHAVLGDESE